MIVTFINYFGENGGIDAWMNVFNYYIPDSKDISNSLITPFKVMKILLTNIITIYPYLNKSVIEKLMPLIKTAIQRRLKIISDKEIKELDKELLSRLLIKAQELLCTYYPAEDIYELTEVAELELALKFLTCPYFEKRLRGINEIKEMSEKIDIHEHIIRNNGHANLVTTQYKTTKYFNAKKFIKWIFDNKIFDLILGDSMHIEIVKRCHDILKFIGKFETIPVELLDLLWNACEAKHEAIVRVIYDTIIAISGYLNEEGIKRLNSKIEAISYDQHSELTLNLIKSWAINTLPKITDINDLTNDLQNTKYDNIDSLKTADPKNQWNLGIDESKFYCVDLLWKLMQDSAPLSTHISEFSLNSLASVLKERPCSRLRKLYLFRCFDNVKKGESVSQSINIIHSILHNNYFNNESSLGRILQELDEVFDIIDILVKNMQKYQSLVYDALKNKNFTEDDKEKAYDGKYSYIINFNNRLIFLEYLITNHGYELYLDKKHIGILWDLYVSNPIFESDRIFFLKWIGRKPEISRFSEPNYMIKKEFAPYFFENILCNHKKFDFINLSFEGFECFSFYFKLINEINEKFKIVKGNKFIIVDMSFEGKEALWSIFLNCKVPQTIEACVNLLVECHMKLGNTIADQKKSIWEGFTNSCMNLLKEGSEKQNERLITKAVMILMDFFDKFEGKNKYETKSENSKFLNHQITVTTILKPENQTKYLQMGIQQSIGVLKRKIAEAYGLALNEFKVFAKSIPLESEDDDTLLNYFGLSGPFFIQRTNSGANESNEYHPKHIIAENSEHIDLLFKLLSEEHTDAVNDIWDLLMRLPVNEKIKKSLYNIEEKWDMLLDTKSMHRLLYCLQIIENFTYDQEKDKLNT